MRSPIKRLPWYVTAFGTAVFTFGCFTGYAQVAANVTSRVMQIRVPKGTGTGFLFDHHDISYIITAEHMVEGAGDNADVELLGPGDHQWRTVRFRVIHGHRPCADVAVLVFRDGWKVGPVDPLPPGGPSTILLGQEAYFLGFPYGLVTDFGKSEIAAPFVKHAYVSGFIGCSAIYSETKTNSPLMLLDGMNNAGFSGGPVVTPDLMLPNHPMKVVGVISGYRNAPADALVDGQAVPSNILANTGLVIVIPIQEVIDLIDNDLKADAK
jgi:S1-C subfamily serine protease